MPLFVGHARSIDYAPFVEDGKVWHMEREIVEMAPMDVIVESYDFDYFIEGDTVIVGQACKKVYSWNLDNTGELAYECALYEGDRVVYLIPVGSEEARTLYDFRHTAGEQVVVGCINSTGGADELFLKQVRVADIGGTGRRAFGFAEEREDLTNWWVEGVGTEFGPFRTLGLMPGNQYFLKSCELNGRVICAVGDIAAMNDIGRPSGCDATGDGRVAARCERRHQRTAGKTVSPQQLPHSEMQAAGLRSE